MRDRQTIKKNVKFYDFDLSKVENQYDPHILFFEEQNPVAIIKTDKILQVFVNGCIIEIKNPVHLSHEQFILLDLFSKGLYYKNITKYKNFKTFLTSLKSVRQNSNQRLKEFSDTLQKAINAEIEKIEITKSGEIISYPPESNSIDEDIK